MNNYEGEDILNIENSNVQWIALYTKARHEKRVSKQLEQMGIESYVPLKKEYRCWSDRRKLVEVPLIPSYVFVHIHPSDYLRMFTAFGIVRVAIFHGRVARIRDDEIELLRRATNCEKVATVASNEFYENEEVEIVDGLFAGYRGKVVSRGNKCKVGICIEELEYTVVIEIPSKDVRVLAPSVAEV